MKLNTETFVILKFKKDHVNQLKLIINSANLSMWMVNVSQAMLVTSGEKSILDLKARHHGLRYAQEIFKILPENTKPINIVQLFEKIPVLGRIHGKKKAA